jgi:hypothetical protein
VEVLVGLGILAVGAISAFVLFPLSAINVSRALVDDRTTTCAITADGELREIHRLYVAVPYNATGNSSENYYSLMDSPGTGAAPLSTTSPDPSYPVVIDPLGIAAGRTNIGSNSTFGQPTLVPRTSLLANGISSSNQLALRFCSQLDGLSYDDNGTVQPPSATMRELRYNWMWVVQRPSNRDRLTTRMQVAVFDRRVHLYNPPNSEAVFSASFIPGSTTITGISTTAELTKGTWIMDATIGNDNQPVPQPVRNGEFYRVVSVTDTGTGTYAVEVHRPVTRSDGQVSYGNPTKYSYNGSIVVMPALAEVYERPVLTGGFGP